MATNPPKGQGRRGSVKDRTQVFNPAIQRFVKRNTDNGQFMNVKSDNKPFKGIRKEK
jgi:hypothetical protein